MVPPALLLLSTKRLVCMEEPVTVVTCVKTAVAERRKIVTGYTDATLMSIVNNTEVEDEGQVSSQVQSWPTATGSAKVSLTKNRSRMLMDAPIVFGTIVPVELSKGEIEVGARQERDVRHVHRIVHPRWVPPLAQLWKDTWIADALIQIFEVRDPVRTRSCVPFAALTVMLAAWAPAANRSPFKSSRM
jgi:hypothetical protein